MSLLSIHEKNPDALAEYRVEQIVALAGDGRLRDGSKCSAEFRAYLNLVDLGRLNKFTHETLTEKFTDSGFVLQDLVNELGRRLSFEVTNGRYHGVANQPGHDGYWESTEARFVVEVKTTDVYRINLSTTASYAMKLKALEPADSSKPLGVLIVVGRQDTGDLEAQIRGSKYAWDVRLISAESLIELTRLHGIAVDGETERALRHSLTPVEYTRVDHLVELLSKIAFDIERSSQMTDIIYEALTDSGKKNINGGSIAGTVEIVRNDIIESMIKVYGNKFERQSRSIIQFENNGNIIISVSKRYERQDQQYWFALQDSWITALENKKSFLCLGMVDKRHYYAIPASVAQSLPNLLNKTEKQNSIYWHIALIEKNGSINLRLPKSGKILDLTKYRVEL